MKKLCLLCFALRLLAAAANGRSDSSETAAEPNLEIACQWWRDLENIWTPIGWKDHAFRFNVLFDGTLLAVPTRHKNHAGGNPGVQITFGSEPRHLQPGPDDTSVKQGWRDCAAPVLWSEWASQGFLLRQEVFAHVPGAKEVETGVEPLFAWVRLSVRDACDGLPLSQKVDFLMKINAPFVTHTMARRYNIRFVPERSQYPKSLMPDAQAYDPRTGLRLLEEGGRVRLGIPAGQKAVLRFAAKKPTDRDSLLSLQLDGRKGNHVDLLVPVLPVEKAVFDTELALGFDKALDEANRFWSSTPATAARVSVPEGYINDLIRRNLQFAEIIAEKNPDTGDYSTLTGSWCYSHGLWATPGAMELNFLDILGYHAVVEKYLRVFKKQQGTIVAPGPSYKLHPGYLSSPKTLTSIDWLSDHGALLWAIAEHALLTTDEKFIAEWLPVVVKACEFIKDSRRIEGHGGAPGIMPPAVATDQKKPLQAVWNDGWCYKGLLTAVRLLKQRQHPRAAEFEAEARAYRKAFQKALWAKAATMPTWTDARGKVHRQVPTGLVGEQENQLRHAFHLDTGPLFLVFSGLMDADDDLMRSTLLWFREGPQTKFYRHDADFAQVPCLHHEMSSCEPCYSWNVFHPWQSGDRLRFLEGMYSLFAGAYSRQTYSMCETRHGITGVCPCALPAYLARLAVADDQIKEGELHLLRLAPLAWLRTDAAATFENMPTEFGPASLSVKLSPDGKELRVTFADRFRIAPKRIMLHAPPVKGLKRITLNGKSLKWDGRKSCFAIQ